MEFSFNLRVESGNRQLELSRVWNDFAMLTQFLSAPAAFPRRRARGQRSQSDFGGAGTHFAGARNDLMEKSFSV